MNKIAFLNDGLRRTFARGRVVMTPAVAELPEERLTQVLDRVRHLDELTPDNDPHDEHDFGSFEIAGVRYFFKIDYYSRNMQGGSEDPADPENQCACSPSCAPTSTDPFVGSFSSITVSANRVLCLTRTAPNTSICRFTGS